LTFTLIIKRGNCHGVKLIFIVAFLFSSPSQQFIQLSTVESKIDNIDTRILFDKINVMNSVLRHCRSSLILI